MREAALGTSAGWMGQAIEDPMPRSAQGGYGRWGLMVDWAYCAMVEPKRAFRGNKLSLPSKPCQACGRAMAWRKKWAKTWDQVKYCSDACRLRKQVTPRA